jgi:preprotein translocase subunit SecD
VEGSQWLKLTAILAMVLGSLYVLAPTVIEVVEGPQIEEAVDKPGAKKAVDRTVELAAGDPAQAQAAADVLARRLSLGGVPVDRVKLANGEIEVTLAPGGREERVKALLGTGSVSLYAFDSVVPGVTEDAAAPIDPKTAPWWQQTAALANNPPPGTAVQLAGTLERAQKTDTGVLLMLRPGAAELPPRVVIGVDGVLEGVARKVEVQEDGTVAYELLPFVHPDDVGSLGKWPADLPGVFGGTLPTTLALAADAPEATAGGDAPVAEATKSSVPPWLLSILPDTKMNLGLDLQGGIDLTLQVELDEAVLSQVGRDAGFARDQAKADGLAVESVKRDPVEPLMVFTGAVPIADLQSWVAKKFSSYEYDGTEGNAHRFRMRDAEIERVGDQATEQVLETLRKRVDATGVKEPSIVKAGPGRINVQLPGAVDLQSAIDAIGTTAVLEFHLVDWQFPETDLDRMLRAAQDALPEDQYLDDETLLRWLQESGRLPEDRLLMWQYGEDADGNPVRQAPYVLMADIILTGGDINNAGVAWDQNQQPYVAIEFKARGSQVFCTVTGENVGKPFAIVLDEQVQSAPNIRERICGGRASIEMGGSTDALADANTLALVLRTGSLNAPVSIGDVRKVGSTLGRDAIVNGSLATVIGSCLVFFFMTIWYRMSGVVANVTLVVNILVLMAILAMFGATLTLPGIAGLALTVGMAVDANIIIYERIREELKLGVNARKAVDAGFEKAFSAIMDGNITTAIAGIVLFSYGSGPIKGFAVTMTVGIVTTLITALFVSRTLMEYLTRNSAARLSI